MAASSNLQLQPPPNFNFKKPDEWSRWKRRFEQFATAAGLDEEEKTQRVSTLLYCLGGEADDVLSRQTMYYRQRTLKESVQRCNQKVRQLFSSKKESDFWKGPLQPPGPMRRRVCTSLLYMH